MTLIITGRLVLNLSAPEGRKAELTLVAGYVRDGLPVCQQWPIQAFKGPCVWQLRRTLIETNDSISSSSSRLVVVVVVVVVVVTDPFQPRRNFVFAISANVRLNDDDGQKHGQRDENHVHAEVRTCQSHNVSVYRTQCVHIVLDWVLVPQAAEGS